MTAPLCIPLGLRCDCFVPRFCSNAPPAAVGALLFPLHTPTSPPTSIKRSLPQFFPKSIANASTLSSKGQIRYEINCRMSLTTVLSGDTLVLIGKPRPDGKPPNERILSLAYVSAPRMKREGDEVLPSKIQDTYS
jgi:hypothetical protein